MGIRRSGKWINTTGQHQKNLTKTMEQKWLGVLYTHKMTAMKLSAWAYESSLIHFIYSLCDLYAVYLFSAAAAAAASFRWAYHERCCYILFLSSWMLIWQLCENDVQIWPSFSVSKSCRCNFFSQLPTLDDCFFSLFQFQHLFIRHNIGARRFFVVMLRVEKNSSNKNNNKQTKWIVEAKTSEKQQQPQVLAFLLTF